LIQGFHTIFREPHPAHMQGFVTLIVLFGDPIALFSGYFW